VALSPRITLYGCWRSSCSHRLQIALRLKQLPFEYRPVNLDEREQQQPSFLTLNPLGQLPVLAVDGEMQVADGVRHLVAHRLHDWTPLLSGLDARSRDFH